MHPLISLDRKIIRAEDAGMSPLSSAALYGKGVFTTIRIRDGSAFWWQAHWRRLADNAERLGIDLSQYSEEETRNALQELISANRFTDGRARVTFFDTSASKLWPYESDANTALLVTTGELRAVPEHFRPTVSPYIVNSGSPLAGVKSCNYLENLMAMDEAKGRGFHEAVRVNERGEVASATMANVFWQKAGRLYTPSLATGCLPGTTRAYVLENLECREVEAGIAELDSADAIYLTSAGLGITSVAEYNGRKLQSPPHPITELLTSN